MQKIRTTTKQAKIYRVNSQNTTQLNYIKYHWINY